MEFFCMDSRSIKDIYCIYEVSSSRFNLENPMEHSVCSLKLGPRYSGEICLTCRKSDCHCFCFAYITLPEPIILQHFQGQLKKALLDLCFTCESHRSYCHCIRNGKFTNKIGFQKTSSDTATSKNNRKYLINECEINEAIYKAKEIFNLLNKIDQWPGTHPKCYLSDIVVVLPNCDRPWSRDGSNILKPHTWTKIYHDIYELTCRYKQTTLNESDERKHILENIYYKANGILKESSQIPSKYSSSFVNRGAEHKTILGSIGGINKSGVLRGYILGKNVARCGRAVAAPNSSLLPGEVELPWHLCRTITIEEIVNNTNMQSLIHSIRKLNVSHVIKAKNKIKQIITKLNANTISFNLQLDDKVYRYLRDGDTVLLNRQPTLHTGSMMAYTLKIGQILPVVRINPCTGKGFNADYDGDEFNIHVPQDFESRADVNTLMHVDRMILDDNGKVQVSLMETSLVGIYLLTKPGFTLTKDDYMQLLQEAPLVNKEIYQGWELISEILNDYLLYPEANVISNQGKIIGGPLHSRHFGFDGCIIRCLAIMYPKECPRLLHRIQRIGEEICIRYGLTIGINECKDFDHDGRQEDIENLKNKCAELCMQEEFNGFQVMSSAGSKGNILAIAPIRSVLGKQTYNGHDIPKFLPFNRTLPTIPLEDNDHYYINQGIVMENLYKGLSPSASALSQFTAREGIAMRSVMTKLSGMFSRILSYSFLVYKTAYDGTVRDNNNIICQFRFGRDGIDPKYVQHVEGVGFPYKTFTNHKQFRVDPSKYMISPSTAVGLLAAQHMSRLVVQATMDTMHHQTKKSTGNNPYLRQLIENKLTSSSIFIQLKVPCAITTWKQLTSKKKCIHHYDMHHRDTYWWELLCDEITGHHLVSDLKLYVELDKKSLIDIGITKSTDLIHSDRYCRVSPWEYSDKYILCIFDVFPHENIETIIKQCLFAYDDIIYDVICIDNEYVKVFTGVGIRKLWDMVPDCDKVNTITNNASDMEECFGMSAARNIIYDALQNTDALHGKIDYRYISFLSDVITYKGVLSFVNISGLKNTNPGPFIEASFRDPVASFKRACSNQTKDMSDSLFKNIAIGSRIPFGTGKDVEICQPEYNPVDFVL